MDSRWPAYQIHAFVHSTRIKHPLWTRHFEPLNIRKCPGPLNHPHSVAGALHSSAGEPEGSATLPGPTGHLFGGSELEGDPQRLSQSGMTKGLYFLLSAAAPGSAELCSFAS